MRERSCFVIFIVLSSPQITCKQFAGVRYLVVSIALQRCQAGIEFPTILTSDSAQAMRYDLRSDDPLSLLNNTLRDGVKACVGFSRDSSCTIEGLLFSRSWHISESLADWFQFAFQKFKPREIYRNILHFTCEMNPEEGRESA